MAKEITYLKQTLSKGEEILSIGEIHWFNYIFSGLWLLVGLLTISSVGIFCIIFGAYLLLSILKTEYVIKNKRVIAKKGIVAVDTSEIKNGKIESVSLKQGFLGRIFGFSDLLFSGTGTSKVVFNSIKDPVTTKSKMEEVIENNKSDK